jgi:mannan endo-1,4-beta-mannosidase
MMNATAQPSQRYKVSNVFHAAAAVGLTVCRTWAFSDEGYQALQICLRVYSEHVFQVYACMFLSPKLCFNLFPN